MEGDGSFSEMDDDSIFVVGNFNLFLEHPWEPTKQLWVVDLFSRRDEEFRGGFDALANITGEEASKRLCPTVTTIKQITVVAKGQLMIDTLFLINNYGPSLSKRERE